MKNELKRCPFCGQEAELIDNADDDYEDGERFKVQCMACYLGTPRCYSATDVVEAWNRRGSEINDREFLDRIDISFDHGETTFDDKQIGADEMLQKCIDYGRANQWRPESEKPIPDELCVVELISSSGFPPKYELRRWDEYAGFGEVKTIFRLERYMPLGVKVDR